MVCVTGGCTVVHTSRFRVVDALSGEPVVGVRAEGSDYMYQPSIPFVCLFAVIFRLGL